MIPGAAFDLVNVSTLTAYRISPEDTVKLVVLASPADGWDATVVFEIWEPDGSQPINEHPISTETFLFIQGSGTAYSNDESEKISAGNLLILPPGSRHRIHNTSGSRLYAITTMVPDDGFADLILRGTPTSLDPRDLAVLGLVGIGESTGAAKPGDEQCLLTRSQIDQEIEQLAGWVTDGASLTFEVSAPDYPTAMQIVNEVGHLGEELGHHADIDIRWKHLTISLSSHTFGGVLPLDVVMAHRVNEVCRRVMNV